MVHPCAGMFAAAEACMLPLKQPQFVGSNFDSFCFGESLVRVAEVFARQFLFEKSNIEGEEMV